MIIIRFFFILSAFFLFTGFSDISQDHPQYKEIHKIKEVGITSGCGNDMYCPDLEVNRAQMAVFMMRLLYETPAPIKNYSYEGIFEDVQEGIWYGSWVENLYKEGITSGCSSDPKLYCPNVSIPNWQMEIFLSRVIGKEYIINGEKNEIVTRAKMAEYLYDGLYHCDIAIIGGTTGGVSAAWSASDTGKNQRKICIFEDTDWIGGQYSVQGVPHEKKSSGFFSEKYTELLSLLSPNANPNTGGFGHLPEKGHIVSKEILERYENIKIFYNMELSDVDYDGEKINSTSFGDEKYTAEVYIDSTDTGEVLHIGNIPHTTGREPYEETLEAPLQGFSEGCPECSQLPTFTVAIEWDNPNTDNRSCKSESECIDKGFLSDNYFFEKKDSYAENELQVPFVTQYFPQMEIPYYDIEDFFTYRRVYSEQSIPERYTLYEGDISMMNWFSHDFFKLQSHDSNIFHGDIELKLLDAKQISKEFIYYLWFDIRRFDIDGVNPLDGSLYGYPNVKIRPDITHTEDGISKKPYIRESRRIIPYELITWELIADVPELQAFNWHAENSLGIGSYRMDMRSPIGDVPRTRVLTKNMQIPIGSIIPVNVSNLISGGKSLGVTHLTNGAYRVHEPEFNIGSAAGVLAAHVANENLSPRYFFENELKMRDVQLSIVNGGANIYRGQMFGIDKTRTYLQNRIEILSN